MAKAIFAGSFDPPTYGHLNIIERARNIFDEIDVVIAFNTSKKSMFSPEERLSMLAQLTAQYKNVSVHLWDKLIVDYAKKAGASVLLRGIRNSTDFAYEFDLSLMNHNLDTTIETMFIPTEPKYVIIKSSSIKELAFFGGDISGITLKDLTMEGNLCPIAINMFYKCGITDEKSPLFSLEKQPVTAETPRIHGVKISGIKAAGCKASAGFIAGLPESPIDGLEISGCTFSTDEAAAESPMDSDMFYGLPEVTAKSFRVINAPGATFTGVEIKGPAEPFIYA